MSVNKIVSQGHVRGPLDALAQALPSYQLKYCVAKLVEFQCHMAQIRDFII